MEPKRIIAKIKNTIIFNCKYTLGYNSTGNIYHNLNEFDGHCFDNKFGYNYEYSYYTGNKNIKIIEGDFKEIKVHKDLYKFEEVPDLNLIYLFVINNGKFKDYNEISLTKEGLISLQNSETNKKLEIKVGRFIRSLLDDNKEFIIQNDLFDFDRIDTNILENITNEYKRYANDGKLKLTFLKGEDILKGYTKENYLIQMNRSSLASSCMTDKHKYLELYTKNSNVELAVLYLLDKVVARCIVWNTTVGIKVYDEIYSNFQWAEDSLSEGLQKLGISEVNELDRDFSIELEHDPEYYPYVDTFFYLDSYKKTLSNESWLVDWDKKLRNECGGYETNYDDDGDY